MNHAESVLVIIVSSILSLFLLVGIIALVKFIQILKHIKHITKKAEDIAGRADAVSEFFEKTAGPAALAKLVSNIAQTFRDKKHGNKEDK